MTNFRILNFAYKLLVFTLLAVVPLLLRDSYNSYVIYYHMLIGGVAALAYDLPVFIKRRIIHGN